jgi:murein DD-endopeptidase MepM/ murein hydrolase activator NlpD
MKFLCKALPVLLTMLLFSCNHAVEPNHELTIMSPDSTALMALSEQDLIYGIPADSFDLVTGEIKRDSYLSVILMKHGVPMTEIDQALNNSKSVFDVRKILPGKNYIAFCEKNDAARLRYFVYEHAQDISYVFSFSDSLNITEIRKPVTTEIRYAKGTISSSLWNAILEGGMPPQLAVALAETFQWSVDFFGIEKGDNFKVVYEEKLIEGKSTGSANILTAQFTSSGKTYTAIPFIQDGTQSFFDTDGKSLRKAFLKAPLKFSRISSRYTSSRLHPVLRIRRPHYGVDYAAPVGTPVYTIGDGKVTAVTSDGTNGKMVKIKHNGTHSTAYLHLSRFGAGIQPGVSVSQGQVIGYVGSTGLSTGPHLDFRFYQNGTPVDPLKVIAPPSVPVHEVNMEKFAKISEVNLNLLSTF